MKRIDSRTVEFTTAGEMRAKERFDQALDEGHSIRAAATIALEEQADLHWKFSRDFVAYLSEDTVILIQKTGKCVPTPKGRQYP